MWASSIFVRYSSTTEASSSSSSLRIDSHLLAQEVLALLALGAGLDVVADPLADLQLGEPLALEAERELQALSHVERLQQLDLLLIGEVGGVSARVGERAGLGDRAHEAGDAAFGVADVQDLLNHCAVLAVQVAGLPVDGDGIGAFLDVDEQPAVGEGLGGAGDSAMQALEGERADRRRGGGPCR